MNLPKSKDLEGTTLTTEHTDYIECDFCSKGVPFKRNCELDHYIADGVVEDGFLESRTINRNGIPTELATYCPECPTDRLLYPCKGYNEGRYRLEIDEDTVIKEIELIDESPEDDGIPWDPTEVVRQVIQADPSRITAESHGKDQVNMGPENVITFLMSFTGMDIRELINYEGKVDQKKLGQIRRKFESEARITEDMSDTQRKERHRKRTQDYWHD